jgi:hypothetical protein
MVSDHVQLIRLCFADEFSEPSCIKETSRCKYQRLWWGALVGAVDDVFQRDNVRRILVSINSGSNSTATEFISCNNSVLRLQSTIPYTYRSTARLDCFLMKTQYCMEHGSMPFGFCTLTCEKPNKASFFISPLLLTTDSSTLSNSSTYLTEFYFSTNLSNKVPSL